MALGPKVDFLTGDDQVTPTLKKQNAAAEKTEKTYFRTAASLNNFETAAVRALNKSITGQERLNRVTEAAEILVKKKVFSEKDAARAIQQVRAEIDGTAAAERKRVRGGEDLVRRYQSEADKIAQVHAQLSAVALTEQRRQQIAAAAIADINGTTAAEAERARKGQQILRQHESQAEKLARIKALLDATNASEEKKRQILAAEKAELDGTNAALAKQKQIVDRLTAEETKVLTKLKAITAEYKRGNIDRQTALRLVRRVNEESLKGLNQQAGANQDLVGQLKSTAQSYFGIAAAVGAINQAYQVWIQNEKERQSVTRESLDAALDFDLLNLGNIQGAREQVLRIGARQGFGRNPEEEQQLFDIAQSLQSSIGPAEKETRKALEAVLQARFVGIPAELGKELVIQAQAQLGRDTDPALFLNFIRQNLRSGQLSGRTAREVARNISALNFFDDKAFGFAAAAKLTDAFAEESKTFVKAGGTALTSVVDRRKIGLGPDASQEDVLRRLAEKGIDSETELRAVGVSEIRRLQALEALVKGFGEVVEEAAENRAAASDTGLTERLQRQLESEVPIRATERLTRQEEAEFRGLRQFDEGVARRRLFLQRLGTRLEERGTRQVLFRDVADETGQARPFEALLALFAEGAGTAPGMLQLLGDISSGIKAVATSGATTAENTRARPIPQQQTATLPETGE